MTQKWKTICYRRTSPIAKKKVLKLYSWSNWIYENISSLASEKEREKLSAVKEAEEFGIKWDQSSLERGIQQLGSCRAGVKM